MRKGKIKALLFIIVFLLVMATAIALLLDMEREKKDVQELGYDPYAVTPVPTLAPTVTPMLRRRRYPRRRPHRPRRPFRWGRSSAPAASVPRPAYP